MFRYVRQWPLTALVNANTHDSTSVVVVVVPFGRARRIDVLAEKERRGQWVSVSMGSWLPGRLPQKRRLH